MKFLVDVCIEGKIARWLKDIGYDVVEVRTINPYMPDEEIIDWAFKESRIILTADKDFGELFDIEAAFELQGRLYYSRTPGMGNNMVQA
ncbi:MAG: hypothetical protein XD78_1155 [Desulfotomaculum sp. 46_296]|nr:MAG: hypothetical protein XD78_1155 [Desulfotomaculum sp. 46_296]